MHKDHSSSTKVTADGITPFMYACQQNDARYVKHLLHRKPSCVWERERTGKTALHYCTESSSTDCIQQLLKASPSLVNAADEEGYTALHLAVIAGNKIVTRYLLDHGADVNFLDAERHSCVHWATVCGEVEALEIVLEAGAEAATADIHGAYPIHYAAQMCGQLKKQISPSSSSTARNPHQGLSVLKKLIDHGVPVDVVDQDGRQPLLWAASSGSSDAILMLTNAGASVTSADQDGLTALHCAASRGHCDCLETLVALCGADVDMVDANGCTALFYAITLGHPDCAQLLLDWGADPNTQDKKGRTPAYCGATKGQMETLRLLAQHGADFWIRNAKGDVALHEAVGSGRQDLVAWLMRQGEHAASVTNNDGRSPLHVAAINNNIKMCKTLIDHGAEVNCIMRNSRGQLMTPLDVSLRRGNRGCAQFLQLHGGLAASKLTDSRALQRALDVALNDNQRPNMSERSVINDDYPLTDSQSQLSTSTVVQLPHLQHSMNGVHPNRLLEDSATQTQLDEAFLSESKDAQIQLTSADLRHNETASGLRRRKIRRRAQRRSLTEARPPPNDEELRWKSRQRNTYSDDSDVSDDHQTDSYNRRFLTPPITPKHYVPDGFHHDDPVESISPIKAINPASDPADEAVRSQSILSNLGTESSGPKDSGFSDLVRISSDRSAEERSKDAEPTSSCGVKEVAIAQEDDGNSPSLQPSPESSWQLVTDRTNATEEAQAANNSEKIPFQFRRTKSERINRNVVKQPSESKLESQVSVTRATQAKTRKYNLERKIFQQLLDLKQMQIRSGQANEQVFAKRLIDSIRKEANTVGLRPYDGAYSFQQLETYLYGQLRFIQGTRHQSIQLPLVNSGKRNEKDESGSYSDATHPHIPAGKCTHTTNRCPHAMYAYTGIPCAAYIPYHRHQQMKEVKPDAGRTILPKLK